MSNRQVYIDDDGRQYYEDDNGTRVYFDTKTKRGKNLAGNEGEPNLIVLIINALTKILSSPLGISITLMITVTITVIVVNIVQNPVSVDVIIAETLTALAPTDTQVPENTPIPSVAFTAIPATGVPTEAVVIEVLPEGQPIPARGSFPTEDFVRWGWICSGDLSLSARGPHFYDDAIAETGVLVILQPDSQIALYAEWGGSCEPYFADGRDRDTLEQSMITKMFNEVNNCITGGTCSSINIIELDHAGTELSNRWVP